MRRAAVRAALIALVLLTMASPPTPALADPPGPTDYLSEVLYINPVSPSIEVRIIGGDSFFELTVARGHEATVIGYRGEPYLRFDADGSVFENQLSPTKYLNEERYGTDSGPAEVDPEADPVWSLVASDGRFAWHDHRTHWMNEKKPVGAKPGDQILEAVVPVLLDGADVDIVVSSRLMERPGPASAAIGSLLGLGLVLLVVTKRLRIEACLALLGGLGLAVGLVATFSVPAETGPPILGWLLPLLALALAILAATVGRRRGILLSPALLMVGFVELGLWVWLRRSGLWSAVIATSLPYWLDRAMTAVVFVSLIGGVGLSAHRLLNPPLPD